MARPLKAQANRVLEKSVKGSDKFQTLAQCCTAMEEYASRNGLMKLAFGKVGQHQTQVDDNGLDKLTTLNTKDSAGKNKTSRREKKDKISQNATTDMSADCRHGNKCYSSKCTLNHPEGHLRKLGRKTYVWRQVVPATYARAYGMQLGTPVAEEKKKEVTTKENVTSVVRTVT